MAKKNIGLDLSGAVDRLVDKNKKRPSLGFAPTGRKKGLLPGLIRKFGDAIWAGVDGSDGERYNRY